MRSAPVPPGAFNSIFSILIIIDFSVPSGLGIGRSRLRSILPSLQTDLSCLGKVILPFSRSIRWSTSHFNRAVVTEVLFLPLVLYSRTVTVYLSFLTLVWMRLETTTHLMLRLAHGAPNKRLFQCSRPPVLLLSQICGD